jgi:squalene cyclase
LRAELYLRNEPFIENKLPPERIFDAVNLILSYQNDDGGWPTYELMRSGAWLEYLNPSEVFGSFFLSFFFFLTFDFGF